MSDNSTKETLAEFKNSFSYGSRSDMNFKFLKSLSDEDAGEFFKGLLWKIGDLSNDADFGPVLNHIFQWQVKAYSGDSRWVYEEAPYSPLKVPISKAKIGLIATSGHFVEGDDPEPFGVKNMGQDEAQARISEFLKTEPGLSSIPINTPKEKICVRHGGYDIRAAQEDHNSVFPIDRMRDLELEGKIGTALGNAYSFVGATAQKQLINKSAPQWAKLLKEDKVDGMILVPV
jgi:hypothetical protein